MNLIHVNGIFMPKRKDKRRIRLTQLKYLLAMKLFSVILIFSLNVSANVYSQKIDLSVSNGSLREVMQQIRKQTGYNFFFKSEILKNARPVNVILKQASIEEALQAIFKNQPFSYQIDKKMGIILRSKISSMDIQSAVLKARELRGTVADITGKPLNGATIRIKGTNILTISNESGSFYFPNAPDYGTMIVTMIGFANFEQNYSSEQFISIILREQRSNLDVVQVIGYGTTTKRLNTGNVFTIKSEIISQQPVSNPLQALSGRIPGVQIITTSGLPGSAVTVKIRGVNSLRPDGNNPLYIIDGVPFSATPIELLGGYGNSGVGSPLNMIAPSDIQSIEVLKDAGATAIYGSRGANGVIIITTKRAQIGKPRIEINVNTGLGEVPKMLSTVSTEKYLQIRQEAFTNSNLVPTIANAPDLLKWDPHLNNNLQKWFLGNKARMTDAGISMSGSGDGIRYLVSGNYRYETTVLPGKTSYKRGNFHLNTGYTSKDQRFSIDANTFFTDDEQLFRNSNSAIRDIVLSIPNYPLYDVNGGYNWEAGKTNFYAQNNAYYKAKINNLNGSFSVKYSIMRGLNIKANVGYNKIQAKQIFAFPSTSYNPNITRFGASTFGNQQKNTFLFEPQISYDAKFGRGSLGILVGSTIQKVATEGQVVNAGNYSNDLQLESLSYGTAMFIQSNTIKYKYLSFFGRLLYNWNNKYIAEGTFRRDGSSRFGPQRQFGNFGSLSGAWLFTNENFIKGNIAWLSSGKIRGSYGTTGNDAIGDYGYLSLYRTAQTYGNANAINPSQIGNPHFQWEVNKKLEFALEVGMFHDRLLFSSSWYKNRSSNQLVGQPLAATTGFSSYQSNLPATVQNKGVEFEINSIIIKKGKLSWSIDGNLAIARNTLVSFPGIETSSYASQYIVGYSLNTIQLFHFSGVDPLTGFAQIEDVNKDGNYGFQSSYNKQSGDYVIAGTTDPKWHGGLNNTINVNGFELNFFFQFTKQLGYNLKSVAGYNGMLNLYNSYRENIDYWRKPGDQVSVPKPLANFDISNAYYNNSNVIISDASFLRLKTLYLGYTFPEHVTKKFKVSTLKLYVQGQNLWTIGSYGGYDAETSGITTLSIPALRVFTAGLQCSL